MKYHYVREGESFKEKILLLNHIQEKDLDTSSYEEVSLIQATSFREILLSLKDSRFLIVGDYDCDGISATAIMKRLLDHLGISSNFTIPSRIKEGYGLHESTVRMAKENGFDVLLTVDNGIAARAEISLAKSLGLNVLIIDHHEFEELPEADAILHPALLPEGFQKLCAAGTCALLSESIYHDELNIVYAGLATQADMVGVLGYNRYLLKGMLELLNKRDIYQINFLSGKTHYDYEDLSFQVIPKINAVSRLGYNVGFLVNYLLSSRAICKNQAEQIDRVNRERQALTRSMSSLAKEMAKDEYPVMIIKDERFEEGLCGLVANRLLSSYHKPILVMKTYEEEYRGSGRSIDGFNLYEYLKSFPSFKTFGGHDKAVGLSILKEDYEEFIRYLQEHEAVYEEVVRDVIMISPKDISYESYQTIEDLKPFGVDFREPVFALEDYEILRSDMMKGIYPKLYLDKGKEAISFEKHEIPPKGSILIGRYQPDRYQKQKVVFLIEDFS